MVWRCLWLSLAVSLAVVSAKAFEETKIQIGQHTLEVEIAKSESEQRQGLMNRMGLGHNKGMLFVYNSEQKLTFWMKDTFIPLSIGFFDSQKRLLEVLDMTPAVKKNQENLKTYQSKRPAQYALEVQQGWFKKHGVELGQKFKFID